jgi:hypothetical protein
MVEVTFVASRRAEDQEMLHFQRIQFMKFDRKLKSSAVAITGFAMALPHMALAQATPDQWSYAVMPYLWLPSVNGSLNYGPPRLGGGSPNININDSQLLDALDMAMMISGTARKERWSIATDLMYLDMSSSDGKVRSVDLNPGSGPINISTTSLNAGADVKLKGLIWTLAGGYSVIQEPKASMDLIGGFRYLGLDTKTKWNLTATVTGTGPLGNTATFARSGSVDEKENIWAAIVGARGHFKLGDSNWFANYYVDVGGGSSVTTWQGAAGLGYAFKWGEVVLDYRYLHYGQSGDKLLEDISFGGFGLGANIHF